MTTPATNGQFDNTGAMTVSATSGNDDAGTGAGTDAGDVTTPEKGQNGDNETTPEPDTKTGAGTPDTGGDETTPGDEAGAPGADMFPRSYVTELRQESAGYRKRAEAAETEAAELAQSLHTALVRLDGRLADADDLEIDPEAPLTLEAVAERVTDLLERKPRLSARALSGDIGQGARGDVAGPVDLISMFRNL